MAAAWAAADAVGTVPVHSVRPLGEGTPLAAAEAAAIDALSGEVGRLLTALPPWRG